MTASIPRILTASHQEEPLVHIVLCTYDPNLKFLDRQISSIIAQTHRHWTCEVRLDPGTIDCSAQIRTLLSKDDRFSFVAETKRLGVYHNFEEGLYAAPSSAAFVAFCDQDDEWVADKLAVAVKAFDDEDVVLVHSDLEAIDASGNQLFPSCFKAEQRVTTDFSLGQLILRNSVTGCACVIRASLLPHVLPFPHQGMEIQFHHDLWIALVASQLGIIKSIDQPLVRYRQHGGNIVGLEADGRKSSRAPLTLKARSWRNNWLLREKLVGIALQVKVPNGRADVQRQRSEIAGWLASSLFSFSLIKRTILLKLQGLPAGDAGMQTIMGKLVVAVIPSLKRARGLREKMTSRVARLKLVLKAGKAFAFESKYRNKVYDTLNRIEPASSLVKPSSTGTGAAPPMYGEQYLAPLALTFTALMPRVVVVVPTGRVDYIFGGLTTIFKFGVALAQQGIPVRFLSTDHVLSIDDIDDLKEFLRERCGFYGDWQAIEIASASAGGGAQAHKSDIFVATIWWSARRIFHTLEQNRFQNRTFYYFIQDYEPGFYAWSNEYALAESTYSMPCWPIVNTQFLADHLHAETGLETPSNRVFNPEIDWAMFHPADADDLRGRKVKRLFFYGRPGTPRNLFDVGLAAIRRFVNGLELSSSNIEVVSAGEAHAPIDLGRGVVMQSVGKLNMTEYAESLRQSDIGLSLMLSPHPSYPPFEMAASGLTVVTNDFSTKHMAFGGNILSTNAAPESLAQSLMSAWERSFDVEARIASAKIDTSSLGRPLRDLIPEIASEMKSLLRAQHSTEPQESFCQSTQLHYRFGFGNDHDFSSDRVCLFSHFDVDNKIDAHVISYLSALKAEGFEIILVTSNLQLDKASVDEAQTICTSLIYRENKGYDFAGWALALRLFPSLYSAHEVLMCNDSVYGPLRALRPIFEKMNQASCDFWGITESREVEWHLQSYFLVFKSTALNSAIFRDFWMAVKALPDKTELIHAYEVPMARLLANGGLRPGVLVALEEVSSVICNPTLNPWRKTLTVGQSPFVKVQLLRDNPLGSDIDNWQKLVAQFGYDPKVIEKHLARVRAR
jgi:glycosyltransferase involved in cell wall biosynthesis